MTRDSVYDSLAASAIEMVVDRLVKLNPELAMPLLKAMKDSDDYYELEAEIAEMIEEELS